MNKNLEKLDAKLHSLAELASIKKTGVSIKNSKGILECVITLGIKTIRLIGTVAPNYEDYFNIDVELEQSGNKYSYRFSEYDIDDLESTTEIIKGMIENFHKDNYDVSKKKYSILKPKIYLEMIVEGETYSFLKIA